MGAMTTARQFCRLVGGRKACSCVSMSPHAFWHRRRATHTRRPSAPRSGRNSAAYPRPHPGYARDIEGLQDLVVSVCSSKEASVRAFQDQELSTEQARTLQSTFGSLERVIVTVPMLARSFVAIERRTLTGRAGQRLRTTQRTALSSRETSFLGRRMTRRRRRRGPASCPPRHS